MKKIATLIFTLLTIGCDQINPPSPELLKAKADEHARYLKGPKFKGKQCFKVTNSKNREYGCTFYSDQGEMFLTTCSEQHPSYRDGNGEGNALSCPANWAIIWSRKIRCLGYDHLYLVPEEDVKTIKCPEELYN